jgi:hypothetical protein
MKQPNSLIRQMTPEEIELEKKRAELSPLEEELVLKELDLTTAQVELEAFRCRYLNIVGVKLAQLDDLKAQIAELLAHLDPKNKDAQKEASRRRTQAQESANATGSITKEQYEKEPFKPSENLKKLYRDLAKKAHPDLAPDAQAREKRKRFMQEVNQAYAERDEARLQSLLNEWERSPDSVSGEGTGAELIRIIRQIALVRNRIETISKEMENLKDTDIYKLKLRVNNAQDDSRDLLSEMAAEVDGQIEEANIRLKDMNKRLEKDELRKTKYKDSKG